MLTLALDVDGVLLDPDRGGDGDWANELTRRFGIERTQLREAFFMRGWDDVVTGRLAIEPTLAAALASIGTDLDVESVLNCWFEADFAPFESAIDLACRVAAAGVRVVLATNQEHRRAAFLRERLGARIPLADVIYSADMGCAKYDPSFFARASERLGVGEQDRQNVIFVDDVLNNVEVARAFGWQAVYATGDDTWQSTVAGLLGIV